MKTNTVTYVLAATFFAACTSVVPDALGDAPKKKQYTIESTAAAVDPGTSGAIELVIKPAKGWKWNDKFPAKLTIPDKASKVASFDQREFKAKAFKLKKKRASLSVPFKGVSTGEETIEANARFSVCDEEACVIGNETVSIKVSVR